MACLLPRGMNDAAKSIPEFVTISAAATFIIGKVYAASMKMDDLLHTHMIKEKTKDVG